MSEKLTHSARILRIQTAELLFDDLLSAKAHGTLSLSGDSSNHAEKLSVLLDYYRGPLWIADYEADERGELPPDLKRGILSQDGFYNFLSQICPGD